jgi:hypothetical protein
MTSMHSPNFRSHTTGHRTTCRAPQITPSCAPSSSQGEIGVPAPNAALRAFSLRSASLSVTLSIGITWCSLTTRRGLPDPEVTARPRCLSTSERAKVPATVADLA